MPVGSATITGKSGPADQITALALSPFVEMLLVPGSQVLRFKRVDGSFLDVDTASLTTFTVTISGGAGGNFVVTVS